MSAGARRAAPLAAVGLCLASGPAAAHSVIPGAGAFVDGLLHPLAVPAHLLVLIALGLWLGQRGPAHARAALPGFLAAMLAGLGLTRYGLAPAVPEVTLLGLAFAGALLVAVGRPLPRGVGMLLALGAGFGVGADSGAGPGLLTTVALTLGGTALGASLILLNVLALTSLATRPWMKVGARVVGSWVAASAVMVLALRLSR